MNLAKGASGFPRPVRVSGEEVSVGPFVSESDEEERFREREETKRLTYVALTRARDRLYLATVLKDGAFAIGRGSLADVLPESFRGLFVRAAQEPGDAVEWTAQSGRVPVQDLPGASAESDRPPEGGSSGIAAEGGSFGRDFFDPLTDPDAIERVAVTEALDPEQNHGLRLPADEMRTRPWSERWCTGCFSSLMGQATCRSRSAAVSS